MTAKTSTDPYALEIIKNALTAIGDEMFTVMARASMSPIIYEALDYSVGVTDGSGELIAQGNGTTVFLGMIDSLVKDVLGKFGKEGNIAPGDVFLSNDPYGGGGTHLSDMALVKPIFYEGRLIAFAVNKAHWVDVGGKAAGSFVTDATEIFQEGLQIPMVKVIDRGVPNQALLDVLCANIRLPQDSMGDFWASVAANKVGEARLISLCERYGLDAVQDAMKHMLDYGERMIALELAKLPPGDYVAEDWIDDDGVSNEPLRVQVRLSIGNGKFVADFTGSAPQALGPINNSRMGLVSAVRTVFKALTDPSIPANGGCFRAVEVICPDATVFTAQRPAPVSTYWETMLYAEDLIWRAMAPCVSDRLPAGHLLSVCAIILAGSHPDTGESTILVSPLVGGWGAAQDRDGQNGQFSVADGETYNIPVEITEARYGVLVERYGFHQEDGGEGRRRGGKGVCLDIRVLSDGARFTGSFGRHKFRPWGIHGGRDGSPNYIEVFRRSRRSADREIYGKTTQLPLESGDVVRLVTATGGGWGDPQERSDKELALDLKDGFVTPAQVRTFFRPEA
jgi:N-methylhydantoinase B